jgi:tetratricopeptide (TPR) repeat protein
LDWFCQNHLSEWAKPPVAPTTELTLFDPDSNSTLISRLNKEATRYKGVGDLEAAIASLRKAKRLRWKTGTSFPIKTWLRLPLFLQKVGRMEEAMAEFQDLLSQVQPEVQRFFSHQPTLVREMLAHAMEAVIYGKMRLACEREKRTEDATRYAGLADLHWSEHKILFDKDQARKQREYEERQRQREARGKRRI